MTRAPAVRLTLQLLACLLGAGAHPIALAAAFWLAPSRDVETNVVAYAPVPFVMVGTVVLAAGMSIVVALVRRTFGQGLESEQIAWGLHLSHLPYAPFWLVALGAFQGLEGNIIGFIVAPFVLLWSLVAIPASFATAFFVIRRMRRKLAAASLA